MHGSNARHVVRDVGRGIARGTKVHGLPQEAPSISVGGSAERELCLGINLQFIIIPEKKLLILVVSMETFNSVQSVMGVEP